MTEEKEMYATGTVGSFRLVQIRVNPWQNIPAYLWRLMPKAHSWQDRLRLLYGMDVWFNRIPLIRTIIVAHLVLWAVR